MGRLPGWTLLRYPFELLARQIRVLTDRLQLFNETTLEMQYEYMAAINKSTNYVYRPCALELIETWKSKLCMYLPYFFG